MGNELNAPLPDAWISFGTAVEQARAAFERTPRFAHGDHQVRAYYCLSEGQAMAYNLAVAPRTAYPIVQSHTSWMTYFYTLGGNCADFHYGALYLDGRQTYRITGRRGDLELILMQVFSHPMGHPGSESIANYDLADFVLDADGSFEIIAGAGERPGNHIRLDPESDLNFVFIRRAVADWFGDMGTLEVVPLAGGVSEPALTAPALAARLEQAANYLTYTIEKLCIGYYDLCLARADGRKNVAAPMPGAEIDTELAGSPSSDYANAIFELEPDQALIVEVDVPAESAYWSMQLYDVWLKSLDFVHHQTDLNMHRIAVDEDAKARVVISLTDPGVLNWLDPVGVTEGILVFRNYRAQSRLNPTIRVVGLSELRDHLPGHTAVVIPEARARDLDQRRRGFNRVYG